MAIDPALRRPRCFRCQLPLRACLCAWARPVANDIAMLVLQHPLEVGHAKGSAGLLKLSLARVQLEVGEVFDAAALGAWLGPPGHSVLLYPDGPDTSSASSETLPIKGSPPAHRQLVVLDGTWRKSLKMLMANPALQALPRLALREPPASRYAGLRAAPRPAQRSTLEACCLALAALERAPTRYAPLLAAFDGFVTQRTGLQRGGGVAGVAADTAEGAPDARMGTRPGASAACS